MMSSLPLQACRILQRYPIPSMKVSCELKCSLYVIFLTRHPTDHRLNRMNFKRLTGEGSSEQGDVQKINDILRQIGDLNVQIKRNQVAGHPSLELQDERNLLLDELFRLYSY